MALLMRATVPATPSGCPCSSLAVREAGYVYFHKFSEPLPPDVMKTSRSCGEGTPCQMVDLWLCTQGEAVAG